MSSDDFSTDARLLIEFGKETRAKNASLQGDMPTLTQQYEVTTQSIAELTQTVAETNLRLEALQEEAKGLEDGSDRVKSLIDEHDTTLNQEGDAALRLRDAEELAIALKGGIELLNRCLTPRKRSAVEVYLCDGTSENLAAAQVENSELLALMKAALADSE